MRRIIFLLLLSLSVMSCSMVGMQPMGILYTGVTTPYLMKAEHQGSYEYQILGEANGQSSAISILSLVAFGDAGYNQAYQNALLQYPQADILIDVSSDYQATSVLGLYTQATTQIHGKAAKLIPCMPSSSFTASQRPPSEKIIAKSQFVPQKESLFQRELKMGFHGGGASYINGSGKYDESGFSLDYNFSRILNEKFNYYVNFSFITMSNTKTKKIHLGGGNYDQYKLSYSTLLFPIYFGLRANSNGFPLVQSLVQKLPVKGVVPYANAGAGWYIISKARENDYWEDSNWSFAVIGLHLGLGSSFNLNKNLSLNTGFNYHILLNEDDVNFWQWKLGITWKELK